MKLLIAHVVLVARQSSGETIESINQREHRGHGRITLGEYDVAQRHHYHHPRPPDSALQFTVHVLKHKELLRNGLLYSGGMATCSSIRVGRDALCI